MKILLAEDTLSARMVAQRHLKSWGHEVVCAAAGAEALATLEDSDFSLVIADWMMPNMDGVELCRRVRAADWGRYIYIIMLTALAEKDNIAEAMDAGADDYATKPLNQQELKARIKAGVRVLSLERQLQKRVEELEESLRTIRQLKQLLPICMYCKKIRNDGDYWTQVEEYIHDETGTDFSHSICPECYETTVKPELEALRRRKKARE